MSSELAEKTPSAVEELAPPRQPIVTRIHLVPAADPNASTADLLAYSSPTTAGRGGGYLRLLRIFFAIPALVTTIYFGFIASDVYISEAKFLVRASSRSEPGGLSILAQSQGFGRAVDETYAVIEYMESRDAAQLLARENRLREVMSRKGIDFLTRYPNFYSRDNEEQFYRAYKRMVDIAIDSSTGITTLEINASLASDANAIAKALLEKAERFVNDLNIRAHQDELAFSEDLVKQATQRLEDVERRLAEYRNTQMILDPEKEAGQSMKTLGNLSTEIAKLEASLAQQMAVTPESPTLAPLRERIKAYRAEMTKLQQKLAGDRTSIAQKLQQFEMLTLERELVAKQVTAAVIEMEKARRDAQSQKIYIQTVVEPNVPDQPLKPRRILWVVVMSIASYVLYRICKSLVESTMDHV